MLYAQNVKKTLIKEVTQEEKKWKEVKLLFKIKLHIIILIKLEISNTNKENINIPPENNEQINNQINLQPGENYFDKEDMIEMQNIFKQEELLIQQTEKRQITK